MKTAVYFTLIATLSLSLSGLAEDKKPARDFDAAFKELFLNTLEKKVNEGQQAANAEYAKGAHALIKEFPGDVRPFKHLL